MRVVDYFEDIAYDPPLLNLDRPPAFYNLFVGSDLAHQVFDAGIVIQAHRYTIPPSAGFWDAYQCEQQAMLWASKRLCWSQANLEYCQQWYKELTDIDTTLRKLIRVRKRSKEYRELHSFHINPLAEFNQDFYYDLVLVFDEMERIQNDRDPQRSPSPSLKRKIIERDGYICRYCGKPTGNMLQIDHIEPHSRGGYTEYDNLVVACYYCNARKRDKHLDDIGMELLPVPK